jgi:hypothetical protein
MLRGKHYVYLQIYYKTTQLHLLYKHFLLQYQPFSTDLPKLDHLRFPGLRVTFGGARPALRGPLGPNRPWPEGGVAGGLVRAVLGVIQNDWAP